MERKKVATRRTTPRTAKNKVAASDKAAAAAPSSEFRGFPRDLFQFLAELGLNNEREWFDPRKARYEESVRGPALAFIRAMRPRLSAVSPEFVAIDKKVGGSLMRPYRDVRFSKDKTPYKTNVGIQFRHKAGKDIHAPGLYMHLEPGECFLGVGLWHPEREALADIRRTIVEHPERWQRVRDDEDFRARFDLAGESLKRPPRGFDPDHVHIEDLKRKDHIAIASVPVKSLFGADVVDKIIRDFVSAREYLRLLCDAVDVSF